MLTYTESADLAAMLGAPGSERESSRTFAAGDEVKDAERPGAPVDFAASAEPVIHILPLRRRSLMSDGRDATRRAGRS